MCMPRVQWPDGANTRISHHKAELVKVQSLFYARRYKECIALCEQLQTSEIHALHQAFLWFYHATCYESTGLIAHNFSGNKLQFLESARESFNLALKCVPLPYVSTEGGSYEQPEESPVITNFGSPSIMRAQQAGRKEVSVSACVTEISPSGSPTSLYSIGTPSSEGKSVADCNGSSSLKHAYQGKSAHDNSKEGSSKCNPMKHPATPVTSNTEESRLERWPSSTRILQDDLVPSPLFSRNPKRPGMGLLESDVDTRPLPPLPFNHKADFKIQGTRIIQDPLMRKTAVQTLIARFEGTLPLLPSALFTAARSPLREQVHELETPAASPGVTSMRFRMIRDAFSPDPHNEHLEAYLTNCTSAALGRYNAHLADFRAQLRKHIAYVDGEIVRVQKIQGERSATKALGSKQRFASFWSFDVASTGSASKVAPGSTRVGRSTDLVGEDHDHDTPSGESSRHRFKKKIDELKRQGWKVCKERHGFKGVEFYEDLRRRVEAELEDGC
ncbi:uncharacterized protein Z520_05518 [Fonsecaea multimorphosa CBS 102226]|uniref:Uncharacterized protein n=1 Tax=Fonsecaea multimorphosa CBS 102226 TaxID=1442371 RepID=A0A0D2JZV1_9EURO|nr:uncharacterized protein Z520_05518 [Fonsecaea multimorphosa CBS 102226]KIX99057.1 hypothetical protein Z520_05518 [Fonsecaea multimorphosa CBS 102226]